MTGGSFPIICLLTEKGVVLLYDMSEHRLQPQKWIAACPDTYLSALTRDGSCLALARISGSLEVYDLERRELLYSNPGNGLPIVDVALAADGEFVCVAGVRSISLDGYVGIINLP
jgi:hypothetical protein